MSKDEWDQDREWDEAGRAFRNGAIWLSDQESLMRHLMAIANQQITNPTIQHRDIIRGICINHMLLQKHIDDLDRKNTTLQRLVLALAFASFVTSVVQIVVALKPPSPPSAIELQVRGTPA